MANKRGVGVQKRLEGGEGEGNGLRVWKAI